MKKLSVNEQALLVSIWHLKEEAYGIKIREKVNEATNSEMMFGTLYNTLEGLVNKGYLNPEKKDPSEDSQNTKRVYYQITEEGFEALEDAWELQKKLWEGISRFPLKSTKKS